MATPEPAKVTRRPTHINGVEIIAVEPATIRHPKFGDEHPVPLKGGAKILLADGTELYLCDDCDFHGPNANGIRSHRNATHDREAPYHPIHSPDVIRHVIREVLKAQRAGGRGYCERAAAALNEAGIAARSSDGKWSSGSVSQTYTRYKNDPAYKVRVSKRVAAAETKVPAQAAEPDGFTRETDLRRNAPVLPPVPKPPVPPELSTPDQWVHHLHMLAEGMEHQAVRLRAMADALENMPQVDPETAEKARRWDELGGLLGRPLT